MRFVYLAPMGARDEGILATVETCLWQSFGFSVRRLAPLPEPSFAFDPRTTQYSSSLIVRELVERLPADAVRLLAVTEKDLFIPMLTFVFGQAQLNGPVAVVSLARLRQEFYQLPSNRILLTARVLKEVLHEVGHTFGLTHCQDRSCTMSLATNIQQLDMKGNEFCRSCVIMLRESIAREERQSVSPGRTGGIR